MDSPERLQDLEDFFEAYARAVGLSDPSRLQVWEDLGLTLSQLRVLHILNADPGMTAGTLAERLGVRPSTVTGIVDRLVKQALVAREADPDDRRVVRNCLTPRGVEATNDLSRASREFLTTILERLADDDFLRLREGLAAFVSQAHAMGLTTPLPQPVAETP